MIKKIFLSSLVLASQPAYAFDFHCDVETINGADSPSPVKVSIEKRSENALRILFYDDDKVQNAISLFWQDRYLQETEDSFYFQDYITGDSMGSIRYEYEFDLDKNTKQATLKFYPNDNIALNNCRRISGDHLHRAGAEN